MLPATSTPPAMARWLGFGGLIPFVLLALATIVDPARSSSWSFGLLAYGAVILSFVGALHWGFATLWQAHSASYRGRLMAWSVVPALGAWIALVLPTAIGLSLLCVLFIAHYLCDVILARNRDVPGWYLGLRTPLSIGAVVSLGLVAATL